MFTVTHREEQGEEEYTHNTVREEALLERTLDFIGHIENDMLYQYYVTEWEDGEIIEQTNADEWLEEKLEV